MPRTQVCLQNQPRYCMNMYLSDLCLVPSSCAWWLLLRCDGRGEVPGITEDLTPFNWRLPPTVGRGWQQILWELWLCFQSKWTAGQILPVRFLLGYSDCPCFLLLRAPLWRPLPSSISQAHTYNAFLKNCLPLATPALKPCTVGVRRLRFALPRALCAHYHDAVHWRAASGRHMLAVRDVTWEPCRSSAWCDIPWSSKLQPRNTNH